MQKFFTFLLLFIATPIFAADWKQWRGPMQDGVSTETGLLESWPENGPELLWKTEILGAGYSNMSFHENMIFSMGDREGGCYLFAMNIENGKELWRLRVGDSGSNKGNTFPGPRCTPATDGNLVFAIGQFGDFVCAEAATGKELWRINVASRLGGNVTQGNDSGINWGFSISPIIDKNKVVLPIGGKDGTLIAFEKNPKEPKILWRSKDLTEGAAYTSIVPITLGGKRQYVLLTMEAISGIDPDSGNVLWTAAYPGKVAICSDPVCWNENENVCYLMAASGYGVGGFGYKVAFENGKYTVEQIWEQKRLESHHGGIVQLGGHFYLLTQRELTCVDPKTGNALWSNRSVGKGSIFAVDGKLIVRSEGPAGTLALVEASPSAYKEISRFEQPDRSNKNSWTYPIVYDGKMYIRDQNVLLCYKVK